MFGPSNLIRFLFVSCFLLYFCILTVERYGKWYLVSAKDYRVPIHNNTTPQQQLRSVDLCALLRGLSLWSAVLSVLLTRWLTGEVHHRRATEAGPRPGTVDTDRVQAPPGRHEGHVNLQVLIIFIVQYLVLNILFLYSFVSCLSFRFRFGFLSVFIKQRDMTCSWVSQNFHTSDRSYRSWSVYLHIYSRSPSSSPAFVRGRGDLYAGSCKL